MRAAFDGNYTYLTRTMAAASMQLDETPDYQEWTQDQLATLNDVRHAALRLAEAAKATIQVFEGRAEK